MKNARRQSFLTSLRYMRNVIRRASETDFTTTAEDRALQQVYAVMRAYSRLNHATVSRDRLRRARQ